ncbi:MAG: DNA repair protein RecO [Saprospiraceae bacterium]|nr:DNA repair protein RecO [Saprospiraceae bacterium]
MFRTIKYGETSVITDIFTEDKGLQTFICGSVRTAKSRMPYSLFQPMMVLEMVSYFKDDGSGGAMHRMKEARADQVWEKIPFDIRRGAVAMFMAEVCRKCIQENEEMPGLFDFLLDNLRWLDQTTHPIANLHLHFMCALSGHLGFQPESETTDDVVFFDLKEGVFVPVMPEYGYGMDELMSRQLMALFNIPLENSHEIPLSAVERRALLQKLLQFYQLHVPNFGELNTTTVLDSVFNA